VSTDPHEHVHAVADLLAWARRISEARGRVNPAQRAAYLAAKTALLGQLADTTTDLPSTKDEQ
jgi:hypothetical protein